MFRVLVVDDDPDINEVLRRALELAGYEVTSAPDGATALAEVTRARPDLLVLDQMLPDIDGAEICRRLRADEATKKMAIMFLTARKDEEARVRGLALGADDYVVKPFSMPELLLRIRAVLRRATPVEVRLSPDWVRLRDQFRVWTGYADLHFARGEWRDCLELTRNVLRSCDEVLSGAERTRVHERLAACAAALDGERAPARTAARTG